MRPARSHARYDCIVLAPTRPLPRVGAAVRIVHFGGEAVDGVVVELHDGGRRLCVRDQGGELHEFALNPATAAFVALGASRGARLELRATA